MSTSPTETFIQETLDGLDFVEQTLISLEEKPSPETVDELFRTLHTIKGSGAMFGFDALASFTHLFENAFDMVREGRLTLDRKLIDLSLAARDHMAELLENNSDPNRVEAIVRGRVAQDLVKQITAIVETDAVDSNTASFKSSRCSAEDGTPDVQRSFLITYTPNPESLQFGARPDLLINEFRDLGKVEVNVDGSAVPPLDELDPQTSYLSWHIDIETTAVEEELREILVFVDESEFRIETKPGQSSAPEVPDANQLDNSTSDKSDGADPIRPRTNAKSESVRVPSARLDDLMDQLGELVIAQTRLDRLAHDARDPALISIAEEIDRLVTGLRDSTLAMRMLPIEVVFGKFRRVVRSLADELGKDVALVTAGGDTELDKNVIDSLTEPLVHMIRNSMDHGIEAAEDRVSAGKSSRATIGLMARQSGGEVLISVTDDGRGLDADAIREKAIERGLLRKHSEDAPSTDDLYRLIFEPAFSTAKSVSSVSGRGVGMDAVRKVVNDLRGSIDIATQKGGGTAITLRLPVTLAIIDGLLVRVGDGVFVLPLSTVNECVELASLEYTRRSGRTLLRIRDELVPFIKLDERFGLPPCENNRRRVVIVSAEGRRIGLVVDDILGQHQTVIKTFSQFHRDIAGFAGSTILGDGRVALIVDCAALIKSAQDQPAQLETSTVS
jgi:two-component system chemotaxis sensor kinase CheA